METETDLCATCGMCCDGTLFAHGMLDPGEAEPPGAAVAWAEDARCFVQPCPQHDGGCAIYADRPLTCRAFRCSVLEDVATGAIDVETAQSRILEVQAVVADLAAALGSRTGVYAAAREVLARRDAAADPAAFDVRHKETLLKIEAFSVISKRYMLRDRAHAATEGADDGGS